MNINPDLCIKCRGIKNLCGLDPCPLMKYSTPLPEKLDYYKGPSPPDIFVGRFSYPRVNIYTLAGNFYSLTNLYPKSIDEILSIRTSLYRVGKNLNIKKVDKIGEKIQEISLSEKDVEIEADIKSIENSILLGKEHSPIGPKMVVKKLDYIGELNIPKKIEYITNDFDLNANDAILILYENNFDLDYIRRIFSSGSLGKIKDRRFIPTRWSITAVDDIIGKGLIEKVRGFDSTDDIIFSFKEYMWNKFYIFILPGNWSFEMIENWYGEKHKINALENGDYEDYYGRKDYANVVGGAYYAARLSVLEYLNKNNISGSVIVYREIGKEYNIPLGVWVIRDTVKDAMKNAFHTNYRNIDELNLIPEYIKEIIKGSRTYRKNYLQKRLDFYG
ncbi:MAG: Nre family DNA repair protein [Thermoplasmata archaeon]